MCETVGTAALDFCRTPQRQRTGLILFGSGVAEYLRANNVFVPSTYLQNEAIIRLLLLQTIRSLHRAVWPEQRSRSRQYRETPRRQAKR